MTQDRFWSKVNIPDNLDDCWEWSTGTRNGYGAYWLDGRYCSAHRVSWELFHHETIPEGMCVCHHCDNKLCVNPDHLFLGTIADNMTDKIMKGRHYRGEAHWKSKLTQDQVLEIRSRKGQTQQSLADDFGVSQQQIYRILSRRSWSHV